MDNSGSSTCSRCPHDWSQHGNPGNGCFRCGCPAFSTHNGDNMTNDQQYEATTEVHRHEPVRALPARDRAPDRGGRAMTDRQDDLQDKRTIDELRSDYATFESEIAKLYDSITVGRISKPHTHTMHVEQIVSERIEDAYADGEKAATDHIVEALRTAAARHDMTPGEAFILEVAAGRIEDGTI